MASTATVGDLVTQIRSTKEGRPDYAFWLGAGASVASGIVGAGQIVTMLLRQAYEGATGVSPPDPMTAEELITWARDTGWLAQNFESVYATTMAKVLQSPGKRKQFLLHVMANAEPSPGYRMLAMMLQRRVVDTIFTTNFDHLVRKATDALLSQPIVEVNASEQFHELTPFPLHPRLVRMHGDFWHGNVLNTEGELDGTPTVRYDKTVDLLRSYGLIVVGYGGADVKVMGNLFMKLGELAKSNANLLSNGLYWCVQKKAPRSPLLDAFLQLAPSDRVYVVEIEDFDSLLAKLAAPFAPQLRWAKVFQLNTTRVCVIRDEQNADILTFPFDRVVGCRGQTAKELGLTAGARVKYRSTDGDVVQTVEIGDGSSGSSPKAIGSSLAKPLEGTSTQPTAENTPAQPPQLGETGAVLAAYAALENDPSVEAVNQHIAELVRLRSDSPTSRMLHIVLGRLYRRIGEPEQAINVLTGFISNKLRGGPTASENGGPVDHDVATALYNRACYLLQVAASPKTSEGDRGAFTRDALRDLATTLNAVPELAVEAAEDTDFEGIWRDPRFQQLIGRHQPGRSRSGD